MQMPAPQEQHRKLQALAGTWVGEEKLFPSPWDVQGGPAVGRVEARLALDGFFLISDYKEERGGQTSYQGHGVYGWDPDEKCYTMHWFDGMGSIPKGAAKGSWDGNTLAFQHQHELGHSRYVYTFEGDGRYTFRLENSPDGKAWKPFMEGKYTRK